MILENAPLQLHDFYVVKMQYQFFENEEEDINIKALFHEYNLDFDFSIIEKENQTFLIFTHLKVNHISNPLPGYIVNLEAVSIFSFNPESELSDKEKADYLNLSGLSISINHLRNHIANTSSSYPFGKYLLPAIDLNALHKAKKKSLKKKK